MAAQLIPHSTKSRDDKAIYEHAYRLVKLEDSTPRRKVVDRAITEMTGALEYLAYRLGDAKATDVLRALLAAHLSARHAA